MKEILDSLEWSEPRREGGRTVRAAVPSPDFWTAWRADKQAVKDLGIQVRKLDVGWQVLETVANASVSDSGYSPAQEAPAPAAAPASYGCASHAPGFVAPAIDDSRPWSAEQLAIFGWFRDGSGSLVVRARAGTGKTTTIKAAFPLAPEAAMLYAVFNKKNQVEAQAVISDPRVDVLTLHALGYRFIRQVWSNARPEASVETDRCRAAAGEHAPDEVVFALRKLVGFAKNLHVSPSVEDLLAICDWQSISCPEFDSIGWTAPRFAEAGLAALELARRRDPAGRISFDDMVWLPVAMGWVRPSYDLVCVDEAQDMNSPQLLIALGAAKSGGRVCVVGDDRQAIYGFRGAASGGMQMMENKLKARRLGLTITYRCPKSVVALAQVIVPDYQAAESAPEGIVRSVNESLLEKFLEVGDAVLSRANAPLMPLCLSLLRQGRAARIEGRDIGKFLLGIVKKLNAKSVPNFLSRVKGWKLKQIARCNAESESYESKVAAIEDQAACLVAVAEGAANVAEISERLLSMFQDSEGNPRPAIVLSSVHKAKGLEWGRVAVLRDTFKHKDSESEEANIFYVAITRAKNELIFVEKS